MRNKSAADDYFFGDLLMSSTASDYNYFKGLEERRIIINDIIDSDIIDKAVIPLQRFQEEDPDKPIRILLNTAGGSMTDGFALIAEIERSVAPIYIEIVGVAASMGILIAMSGHNKPNVHVTCNKYAIGLLHSGSSAIRGNSDGVADTAEFNKGYEREIVREYVLAHSAITPELYDEKYREQFWMQAKDMLKYEIVEAVV